MPLEHVAAETWGLQRGTLCCACMAGWPTPTPSTGLVQCPPEMTLAHKDVLCVVLQVCMPDALYFSDCSYEAIDFPGPWRVVPPTVGICVRGPHHSCS